jgi:predicted nucleotide-binding protein
MASKEKEPAPVETPKLNAQQIEVGVRKLNRRLVDLQDLADRAVAYDSADVGAVEAQIRDDVLHIFGERSPQYKRHQYFKIATQSHSLGAVFTTRRTPDPRPARQREFAEELPKARTQVGALIRALEEMREDADLSSDLAADADESSSARGGNRVFVVHGHNGEAEQSVARLLQLQELEAVILHEQPNSGKTIIEKLETAARDIAFCVVLLTPDDEGHPRGQPDKIRKRARQNVIAELFLFIGALGRERVCALYSEGVELPSDLQGLAYVVMDEAGAWKMELVRELRAAGLPADANKLR